MKTVKTFNILLVSLLITTFLLITALKETDNKKTVTYKTIVVPTIKCQINWVGHWRDEGDKGKFVKEIANEYEFRNQEIKVNLKFPEELYKIEETSEVNFIVDQIKKPVADWDIIRLFGYHNTIAEKLNDPDWAEKYLVDLSQVPGFTESHKSFISGSIYKKRFKNRFFGPYNECQLATLYVNTEVAKKMGITVKQFNMTYDDFLNYIKAANEYNKTHTRITPVFEYDWNKAKMIFKILYFSLMDNQEEILDAKLTTKKLDAIKKCFEAFEELSKYNPINKNWTNRKWANENDNILKDSCLFFPNFTFMYNIWKKKNNDFVTKVIPCEFPVFKPSKVYIGGYNSNFAILKNSPHKDEAIKLLMYWCRPEVAEKWVRYSKSPSGVKGNLATSSLGADPYDNYSYMMDKKYGDNLITDEDYEYIVGEKNKGIQLKFNEVIEGKLSAQQAFNEFKSKAILQ